MYTRNTVCEQQNKKSIVGEWRTPKGIKGVDGLHAWPNI
jgi:hypothetical protein